MPGVDLEFPLASPTTEIGSPECAESGLEAVIGDFLAQDVPGDEDLGVENKFESLLRCAVREIHMDLKAFGKQIDKRLEEAAATVAPLAQTLVQLQEENKILRNEQEKVMKKVEALCKAMGLKHPLFEQVSSEDIQANTTHILDSQFSSSDFSSPTLCVSENPACGNSEIVAQECKVNSQDFDNTNCTMTSESTLKDGKSMLSSSKSGLQGSVFSPLDFVSEPNNTISEMQEKTGLNSEPGIADDSLLSLHDFECTLPDINSSQDNGKSNCALNSPIGISQGSVLGPQDFTDELTGTTSELINSETASKEDNNGLNSPVGVPQGSNMEPQEFECLSNDCANFEEPAHPKTEAPVPNRPGFSNHLSLSLEGYTPSNTVPLLLMHFHLIPNTECHILLLR